MKQGKTLLLWKLLSLSSVFMGCLFLYFWWEMETRAGHQERSWPLQSVGIFLRRSSPAARSGQFNISIGQQVTGLVEEDNKQQHAKGKIWSIINLLWVGGSGAERKGTYHRLFLYVVLFLFSLFIPSQIMCCFNKPIWFTACEQGIHCSLTVLTAWFGFSVFLDGVSRWR